MGSRCPRDRCAACRRCYLTVGRGKELVKHASCSQLSCPLARLKTMHHLDPHPLRRLLLLAAVTASAWVLGGCAVPVANGYGYDYGYGGYGPVYQEPMYGAPPVVYGTPPVVLGGQIWIDSSRRDGPRRWREAPRWRENQSDRNWRDHRNQWQQQQHHLRERQPDANQQRRPPRWQSADPGSRRNRGGENQP